MKTLLTICILLFMVALGSCTDSGIRDNLTDPASPSYQVPNSSSQSSSSEEPSSSSSPLSSSSEIASSSTVVVSSSSFACENVMQGDTLMDCRDGNTYPFVVIGEQTWLAENMNLDSLDGRCYKDSLSNCDIFGRLYSWEAAKQVCPFGWRLPSENDWIQLRNFVDLDADGNSWNNNEVMSLRDSIDWIFGDEFSSNDKYGFHALPGGAMNDDYFIEKNQNGNWWTSSFTIDTWNNKEEIFSVYVQISYNDSSIIINDEMNTFWRSVRCIKE